MKQQLTGDGGEITRITPARADPNSQIPSIGHPGFALGRLSFVFQQGVPLALVDHIDALVVAEIEVPAVAGPETVHRCLELACREMLRLVNEGRLYRDPIRPGDWVYEDGPDGP